MQTELHRHLDVSLRLSTLLKLAQERGLEGQSTSLEAFRKKVVLSSQLTDLKAVLATFTLFQKVLDRPEVLAQVAFEVVEDMRAEGTRQAELRFSPSFVAEYNSMSWDDVLAGFEAGIQRAMKTYPEMRAGLICIASRDYGVDPVAKSIEFFLKHRKRFLGFDLAGNEAGFPCRLYEGVFKPLRESGAKITIHAGEATGPENMWEAIELLGAHRIGHGIACVKDPLLMTHLAKNSICLEMCPTSNYLTQAVKSLDQHPLPQALKAGVPVSVNTDDPTVFGCNLPYEFEICRTQMKMSEADIQKCIDHANKASFFS